jgi:hypothetical protein
VEAHRVLWRRGSHIFSRQSAHRWRWGCQPYAPTALYPSGRFLGLLSVGGWIDPRAIVRLEGLSQLKKSNDLFGNRTRDHPACSIMPQPTTLQPAVYRCIRAPRIDENNVALLRNHCVMKVYRGPVFKLYRLHNLTLNKMNVQFHVPTGQLVPIGSWLTPSRNAQAGNRTPVVTVTWLTSWVQTLPMKPTPDYRLLNYQWHISGETGDCSSCRGSVANNNGFWIGWLDLLNTHGSQLQIITTVSLVYTLQRLL